MAARLKAIADRGISFHNDIDPSRWPEAHRDTFNVVQRLKSTVYSDSDIGGRANILSSRARECQNDKLNEAEWRSRLEAFIFQRLDDEFLCRRCRGTFCEWKINDNSGPSEDCAVALFADEQTRAMCQCHHGSGPPPVKSKLFGYAQTGVPLDDDIASAVERTYEVPDRVYSLRRVATLDHVLGQKDGRQGHENQTLRESLPYSLYPKKERPLAFPFVLLESKSGTNTVSFDGINIQVAFVAEKMLRIQEQIRGDESSSSPLIWCFLHKGPKWRVSAGYYKPKENERSDGKTEIAKLWEGDITNSTDSTQLLRIVDHIANWAYTDHRKATIHELQQLALPRTPTITKQETSWKLQPLVFLVFVLVGVVVVGFGLFSWLVLFGLVLRMSHSHLRR
ncbi:hypothetical protein B0T24DRAFT_666000 [Lasiosphaeria ovina]|uniref:Uncharacterized protein n=1 Tax=Lasiosphaeria ovina TaxID=92902 RepID=A0AAE0NC56_9PEZI|nr:hypothetical protein B0T24DRAFT_666000 [Lasiosphaeria ovina]